MKHTIILIALLVASIGSYAQTSDTAKKASVPVPPPQRERSYYLVLGEGAINKLFDIVDASDEPYATVRKPLKDALIYWVQHQPKSQDTTKAKP